MRLLRAQLHTGESGEGGGEGGGEGEGGGGGGGGGGEVGRELLRCRSRGWRPHQCDEAVAAPPFLGSPGPQLDLPEDPQPVHFFEPLVDDDVLQLIVTETNRCRNRFRDLGRGVVGNNTKATICIQACVHVQHTHTVHAHTDNL